MCAVDALGLPPMTGRDGRITSSDPDNGKPVTITAHGGSYTWEPASTMVTRSVARPYGGTLAACSCPLANFHTGTASAQAFISGRDTAMVILDQDAAVELATYEFSSLLGSAPAPSRAEALAAGNGDPQLRDHRLPDGRHSRLPSRREITKTRGTYQGVS